MKSNRLFIGCFQSKIGNSLEQLWQIIVIQLNKEKIQNLSTNSGHQVFLLSFCSRGYTNQCNQCSVVLLDSRCDKCLQDRRSHYYYHLWYGRTRTRYVLLLLLSPLYSPLLKNKKKYVCIERPINEIKSPTINVVIFAKWF